MRRTARPAPRRPAPRAKSAWRKPRRSPGRGNASNLFDKVFGDQASSASNEAKNEIVVNPVTGTVTVLATERQHGLVQAYLDGVQASSQRQVLIESPSPR